MSLIIEYRSSKSVLIQVVVGWSHLQTKDLKVKEKVTTMEDQVEPITVPGRIVKYTHQLLRFLKTTPNKTVIQTNNTISYNLIRS